MWIVVIYFVALNSHLPTAGTHETLPKCIEAAKAVEKRLKEQGIKQTFDVSCYPLR